MTDVQTDEMVHTDNSNEEHDVKTGDSNPMMAVSDVESEHALEHEQKPTEPTLDEPSAFDLSPHALGARGEKAAQMFLRRHGMRILDTNWRAPVGEIDIVAHDGDTLRFVEVKTCISDGRGFPEEHVTRERRKKYEILAEYYLKTYEDDECPITFDIISMLVTGPYRAFLRYHRNVLLEDCSS